MAALRLAFLKLIFLTLFGSTWHVQALAAEPSNENSNHTSLHTLIRQLSTYPKLASLSECICREFSLMERSHFTLDVWNDIEQRFAYLKTTKTPLLIVSYASGRLRREFILIKNLILRGFDQIIFIPIDPLYKQANYGIDDKGSPLYQMAQFFLQLNASTDKQLHILPVSRAQDYLSALDKDPIFKAHILLDIDSDAFLGDSDFHLLYPMILHPTGVAYSLRHEEKTTGYIMDAQQNRQVLPRFRLNALQASSEPSDF